MDVRLGWSGEVHGVWTKMDVEVSECDFDSLLAEKNICLPENGAVPPLVKFKIMYSLAETYVQLHKMARYPEIFDTAENKSELASLVKVQSELLESLSV